MNKDQHPKKPTATDHRVASRNQKENQASQLSAANAEESPYMDGGDSAAGAGESLEEGPGSRKVGEAPRREALDTQYGTKSLMKTAAGASSKSGQKGRASSGGSGAGGSRDAGSGDEPASAPSPGSSEESSGAERDTMTGPRPGGRS